MKIFSLSSSSIPMHWYPPFLCDQRLPKDRIGNLSVFFEDLLTLFLQPPLALSPFGTSTIASSLRPLVFYLNQFHLQVSLLHNSHFDCLRYHPQKIHRSNYLTPFLHFVLNIPYHVIGGRGSSAVERATPGEEVPGSIPAVAARSLQVGSVSV